MASARKTTGQLVSLIGVENAKHVAEWLKNLAESQQATADQFARSARQNRLEAHYTTARHHQSIASGLLGTSSQLLQSCVATLKRRTA